MRKSSTAQGKSHLTIFCIIACSTFLFTACGTKIRPHKESGTDVYCVYKIDSVINPKKAMALSKGDTICLYCPKPHNCELNKKWVEVYTLGENGENTGIEYLFDNSGVSCTSCPTSNKFETF